MLKIKEENVINNLGHYIDYILENGIELYTIDWNGEQYNHGYNRENGKDTEYRYIPVYSKKGYIIGFEEVR